MARVDCRVCNREIVADAETTTSVRGWGFLCAECEPRVEIVRNPRGVFVRANVRAEEVEQR